MVLLAFLEFLTQIKWLLDNGSSFFTSNTGLDWSYEEERKVTAASVQTLTYNYFDSRQPINLLVLPLRNP